MITPYILTLALLLLLIVTALWSVMQDDLLRAAIALAGVSIIVTLLMFQMAAPLAAVFELSVCAGLITVVFVSVISLTRLLTREENIDASRERMTRFWYLPVLLIIVGVAMSFIVVPVIPSITIQAIAADVRQVLWNERQLDMLGQILVILTGVFGIVVLFKDKPKVEKDI